MQVSEYTSYKSIVESIEDLNWKELSAFDLTNVAVIYYYFSIQFRENLMLARSLHPDDEKLKELETGECDTSNLSPWPNVAAADERMNHDEFMRRALELSPIDADRRYRLDRIGQSYLRSVRAMGPQARAQSIASYEDGGLERVFRAILTCQDWNSDALRAFRHFLVEHIKFDTDPESGHGALSRHLRPTEHVVPLWESFRHILVEAAPALLV